MFPSTSELHSISPVFGSIRHSSRIASNALGPSDEMMGKIGSGVPASVSCLILNTVAQVPDLPPILASAVCHQVGFGDLLGQSWIGTGTMGEQRADHLNTWLGCRVLH